MAFPNNYGGFPGDLSSQYMGFAGGQAGFPQGFPQMGGYPGFPGMQPAGPMGMQSVGPMGMQSGAMGMQPGAMGMQPGAMGMQPGMQQGMYPQQYPGGQYPQQPGQMGPGGYPQQQQLGGYPPQQGYPQQQPGQMGPGGYPPQQGPPQQGYPGQQPGQMGPGGYPQQQPPPQQQGFPPGQQPQMGPGAPQQQGFPPGQQPQMGPGAPQQQGFPPGQQPPMGPGGYPQQQPPPQQQGFPPGQQPQMGPGAPQQQGFPPGQQPPIGPGGYPQQQGPPKQGYPQQQPPQQGFPAGQQPPSAPTGYPQQQQQQQPGAYPSLQPPPQAGVAAAVAPPTAAPIKWAAAVPTGAAAVPVAVPVASAAVSSTAAATAAANKINNDPSRDADDVHQAMKGLRNNDGVLIKILAHRTPAEMEQIRAQYITKFGKDLLTAVKSETHGHFEQVLSGLVRAPREYDSECLYNAMHIFTHEETIHQILISRSNDEKRQIDEIYQRDHKKSLRASIEHSLSGHLKELCLALLDTREDEGPINKDLVVNEADLLYQAGEGKIGSDSKTFIRILATRSWSQVYESQRKHHTLEHAINSEFSGHMQHGLRGIVTYARNPGEFWADVLYRAMKGLGTDDKSLIRAVVCERYLLLEIKRAFSAKYTKSLYEFVNGDTSGDYKKLLLDIVENC